MKNEICQGEFEGLIIDRSKSQQEIHTQIDQLAVEFQKAEGSEEILELESDGGQYFEAFGDVSPGSEKLGRPHSKLSEWGGEEKEERAKRREGKEQIHLEVELDLGWETPPGKYVEI